MQENRNEQGLTNLAAYKYSKYGLDSSTKVKSEDLLKYCKTIQNKRALKIK